ncbi:DUF2062 domain-containing protein [Limibaculum sp. M0105]|uniref:DUF2062 domain-containing protein n=1 Tax=Thermohalobaculum xanthum TaxID=2753746 RepID=A0A8J7SGA9_9RHOB|nr:DUF2062 domain-containing protein [Thermohalobaculum xanthum]MBK0400062.1 DUF2062 domain-containing protein [Thermohalobaculum xanthum]
MIFKRREKPPFWDRMREIMYPRKGALRGVHYLRKRIHRLPDSPHRIALGFACGAMASFTPFFGFHFGIAAALAFLLRGNLLASAFGTAVGNPLTFPFIAAASLQTGWLILGNKPHVVDEGFSVHWLVANIETIFVPYLVGGIAPGLLTSFAAYWLLGPIVEAYQERRRKKLEALAADRRRALDAELSAYTNGDRRED